MNQACDLTYVSRRGAGALLVPLVLACSAGMLCDIELPCPAYDEAGHTGDAPVGPDTRYVGSGDPYAPGPLTVRTRDIARCQSGAPRAMQVHEPVVQAICPVVVFQHGFLAAGGYYSEILRHLASHGFVVVAPQMYPPGGLPICKPTAEQEVDRLIELLDWLPAGLEALAVASADTETLGIAGHSRGGRIAWLLLMRDSSRARSVAGVDPVDGAGWPPRPEDRITSATFAFALPSLVIGTGLDADGLRSCAPAGFNHEQFYAASPGPAWHVVAPEAGHMDMLDENLPGCGVLCTVCAMGDDRDGMRRLTAGLLVAFFRASLQGDASAYAYLTDSESAPIRVVAEAR